MPAAMEEGLGSRYQAWQKPSPSPTIWAGLR